MENLVIALGAVIVVGQAVGFGLLVYLPFWLIKRLLQCQQMR